MYLLSLIIKNYTVTRCGKRRSDDPAEKETAFRFSFCLLKFQITMIANYRTFKIVSQLTNKIHN